MATGRPVVQDEPFCLIEIVAAFLEEDNRALDQHRELPGRGLVRNRSHFGECR